MPRRGVGALVAHSFEQVADGLPRQLRGITGSSALKGHVAVDPDSEIITATAVPPGNSGDAEAAEDLLADLLPAGQAGGENATRTGTGGPGVALAGPGSASAGDDRAAVYGDAAYGSGELLEKVEQAGLLAGIKVQPPPAPNGHFPKDRFGIDLHAGTVTCPAGMTAVIRARTGRHAGAASFGAACRTCPLAAQCTTAPDGRTITIGPHEARLAAARIRQSDPAWKAGYRATRPKVERKIGHLKRRRHGGRRAQVRGKARVAADFALLAAAVNLARLGVLGAACHRGTWAVTS